MSIQTIPVYIQTTEHKDIVATVLGSMFAISNNDLKQRRPGNDHLLNIYCTNTFAGLDRSPASLKPSPIISRTAST